MSTFNKWLHRHDGKGSGKRFTLMMQLAFLIVGLQAAAPGVAEESRTTEPADEQTESETILAEETASEKQTEQTESTRDKEIFRPSEEISEDFAVSFPVDI